MTALALAASTLLSIAIPAVFCALWIGIGAWISPTYRDTVRQHDSERIPQQRSHR